MRFTRIFHFDISSVEIPKYLMLLSRLIFFYNQSPLKHHKNCCRLIKWSFRPQITSKIIPRGALRGIDLYPRVQCSM